MRYYEILYIMNPNFEKKKIDSARKDINDRVKKTNSNISFIIGNRRYESGAFTGFTLSVSRPNSTDTDKTYLSPLCVTNP